MRISAFTYTLLSVFVVLALSIQSAEARCGSRQRQKYEELGLSDDEIARLCDSDSGSSQSSRSTRPPRTRSTEDDDPDWANRGPGPMPGPGPTSGGVASMCMTQMGPCQMMARIPIGSSCFCMTQFGQIPGVAR
jgi:hypothetical protein